MIWLIISLFSITALIGIILLSYILQNKETRKGLAFIHGPLAVISLILLVVYTLNNPPGFWESIGMFALAALGGAILFVRDLMRKSVPVWLGLVHGMAAAGGLTWMIIKAIQLQLI